MISPNDVKTAVVAHLLADTALTSALVAANSTAQEVRESGWQGADFKYPNVRVGNVRIVPDGECDYVVSFDVSVFDTDPASDRCGAIQALVSNSLHQRQIITSAIKMWFVNTRGVVGPFRNKPRVWQADDHFVSKAN